MSNVMQDLIGSTVYDAQGEKIGDVTQVYLDDRTGAPSWVATSTGMFHGDALIPLTGASHDPGKHILGVPVSKERVKSAPQVAHDGHISPEGEQQLFAHYGLDANRASQTGFGRYRTDNDQRRAADDALVRSEERLNVRTESEEVGKARLRKYVVTEEQSVTVPVEHEEVRIEREPITDPSAVRNAEIGEAEQEVTLHADRVKVNKQAVPVEKVRLAVDEVEDERTVSDTVRKERFETEGVDPRHRDERRER
ncbi:PRC and DUF2382 domain-containing protein [Nocardia sp. CDC159]|uniref:PRC and DUF2382 domain-containing protein n=1 Tax=Nocardia pulmonis TaxID=2951408 RepID=A0A9X2E6P3_9NOCA|nr:MULTISPECIES: PRC and DUF2382 domain-containing protein [Nocardia]MCM6774153.1 PRC and DUF2382 domain-containing protein [Nocardia pulmonis]MCM6787040.1 PRC and DUF2382 domain-containing protein [Nocardia sp. CDC159]